MTEADHSEPLRPAERTPPRTSGDRVTDHDLVVAAAPAVAVELGGQPRTAASPGQPGRSALSPASPVRMPPPRLRAAGAGRRDTGSYLRHLPFMALAAATAFAILGYSVTAVMLLEREAPPSSRPAPPVFVLPLGSPPVSVLPSPAVPSVSPKGTRSIRNISTGATRRPSRSNAAPSRSPTGPSGSPAPAPAFAAGHTIGMGLPAWPGHRVRHRDSVARAEPVTSSSSPADRLATRFVVETGRADRRCVSFASADHPGHYLRHRDFVLRLEPADSTALFQHDATFCPTPAGDGFALRSANYPRHHLIRDGGLLRLVPSEPGQATVFRALPPI